MSDTVPLNPDDVDNYGTLEMLRKLVAVINAQDEAIAKLQTQLANRVSPQQLRDALREHTNFCYQAFEPKRGEP